MDIPGSCPARGTPTVFWILSALFHVPLYLLLLVRTWRWGRGTASSVAGFPLLFYWAYWIEHAVLWGDPRFGLAVYPVLVAMVIPPAGTGEGNTERFTFRPGPGRAPA
ncbi:MAG TPA: hypothetical protein VE080_00785 [Candidatus Aquicultoraceae bacterium]|nr:hypothetical protein [Candidatus Aquicultoraceae bacterium]